MHDQKPEINHIKGRGAQSNSGSRFNQNHYEVEHIEGIDEEVQLNSKTQILFESPKKVINKVLSPDIPTEYSLNAYQGCEHGCVYCYARNTHEYYGLGAGLDFESKIIVKKNVVEVLEKQFNSKTWKPSPIMLSGNTDCYQPLEREFKLTRSVLELCLKYRNPINIVTKNSLVLRDIDILQEMASLNLATVMISLTSLREETRRNMEPRTASSANRLKAIKELSSAGIYSGAFLAPIIPGINSDEIPALVEAAASNGASMATYMIVRLNGSVGPIFEDWLQKAYPDRADKVMNQIKECHGGQINDNRFGTRMKGEGKIAESIKMLFTSAMKRHMTVKEHTLDTSLFEIPLKSNDQLTLF